jgi:hypothetical protein
MLKQVYVRIAQAIPALLPGGHSLYAEDRWRSRPSEGRWVASLGAIYHFERMAALDIPWWNVAATRVVEQFLKERPGARVFEYGSGASTLWLARRSAKVHSVEHDRDWAERLRAKLAGFPGVDLRTPDCDLASPSADQPYVQAIRNTGEYDLIIVDGRLRNFCLAEAIPHLKRDGMIVFDDSGRERYRPAIERCGLSERRFYGLSYCVPYPDQTSILTHGGDACH